KDQQLNHTREELLIQLYDERDVSTSEEAPYPVDLESNIDALRNVIKNEDSSAPQGVRHGEELEGAPPVDPGKLGGVERGRDPRRSAIGICQRRETLPSDCLLHQRSIGACLAGASLEVLHQRFTPTSALSELDLLVLNQYGLLHQRWIGACLASASSEVYSISALSELA
ncbi:hypothetical protein Tco_1052688, partial [Tanacetum coccineum]